MIVGTGADSDGIRGVLSRLAPVVSKIVFYFILFYFMYFIYFYFCHSLSLPVVVFVPLIPFQCFTTENIFPLRDITYQIIIGCARLYVL